MRRLAATLLLCGAGLAQAEGRAEAMAARIARIVAAADAGEVERTVRDLCEFRTRHVLSAEGEGEGGAGDARRYLQRRFAELTGRSGGRLRVEMQRGEVPVARLGMPRSVAVTNVLAWLPGDDGGNRVFVVGGHYDSRNSDGADGAGRAPGANDDASGTAVALEVCRLLCAERLPATLLFCAFDGEEQGLVGSKLCAQRLAGQDLAIGGMIACDIVGNTLGMDGVRRDDYVRCFSYAPSGNDSSGRSLARAVALAARAPAVGIEARLVLRGDRYGRGGDHRSFFEEGFPAVRLTEPREDYSRQHQDLVERDGKPYGDLPDYVDFGYVAAVARVVAATLCELASAPPPPLLRSAMQSRTAYDTIVEFEAPASAAKVEFVWRETTAADWAGVVPEADVALAPGEGPLRRATLRSVPLDDVVVGARSVAADGARSCVATPPEPDRFQQRAQRETKR